MFSFRHTYLPTKDYYSRGNVEKKNHNQVDIFQPKYKTQNLIVYLYRGEMWGVSYMIEISHSLSAS